MRNIREKPCTNPWSAMLCCTCLIALVLPFVTSQSCTPHHSLLDRGLKKVVLSDEFEEVSLPDMIYRAENLYGINIGFSEGKLTGLHNIRRSGQAVLNIGSSGSRLNYHIEGGPLDVRYSGGVRSDVLQSTFRLTARAANFRASFTVEETSPNHLRVHVHNVRMSRIRLLLNSANQTSYDFIAGLVKPFVERKVGQVLARELRKMAVKTLGEVTVFATNSEEEGVLEEGSLLSRTWQKALDSASSYLALLRGQNPRRSDGGSSDDSDRNDSHAERTGPTARRREPRSLGLERERWFFDGCLSKLVFSLGLEPAQLPSDLEEFNLHFGRVSVAAGNMTGLSTVYRSGESVVRVGDCGLSAHFDLGFRDITISALASVDGYIRSTDVVFNVFIPGVQMLVDVRERDSRLEIDTYTLNFPSQVTVTASPLTQGDSFVNVFAGRPDGTLRAEELEQLKASSQKYVQELLDKIARFIGDPPVFRSP
ncbi:uncharacterized protein LOC144178007 [Haemaphysalis longicornis]